MKFKERNIYGIDENNERHLIATRVAMASTFFNRFKGLMFEKTLEEKHTLIIHPCSSIHMMFMKFPLDIIYTDVDFKVLKVVKGIKPWKIDTGVRGAIYTFELPVGSVVGIPIQLDIEDIVTEPSPRKPSS